MSTNFYLAAPHLDEFKDDPDDYGLHIGKSSGGWVFSWRAHPELDITCRDDWERMFRESGDAMIVSEYNVPTPFSQFREMAYIESRDPDGTLMRHASQVLRGPQCHLMPSHLKQTFDEHGESFSHYWFM